jgi:hypothetical protein
VIEWVPDARTSFVFSWVKIRQTLTIHRSRSANFRGSVVSARQASKLRVEDQYAAGSATTTWSLPFLART